ncbi:MAG: hypothetical protein RR602_08290 [Longicatena sp.]
MNASGFKTSLNSTVSISDDSKIILKDNKPLAVLISINRFQELLEKEEDLALLQLAISRHEQNPTTISRDVFFKNNEINEAYINNPPEIELE